MTTWWYESNGKQTGPLAQRDIIRLIQRGIIVSKTLLWKIGMDTWLPLGEIMELQAFKVVPPPLPLKKRDTITPTVITSQRIPDITIKYSNALLSQPLAYRLSRFLRTLIRYYVGSGACIFHLGFYIGPLFFGFC
ncbi:MAG: DUF4339 domain-containing protein [Hydrogenophilales bacterium]|nr:DUF4339 domain-containing protein [Hydrogenophilales bacterium]